MTAIAYAKWIAGAVLLVLYSAFWYHLGGEGTRLKVANTEVRQATAEQRKETKDEATVAEEAKRFETATDPALTPVAAPLVRLCHFTPVATVSSANAAGSGTDASAPVRAAPAEDSVPGPDIGGPIVQVGHNADAQVAGLQHYIEHVCQARAPQ
jgi:hypothetical protein